jgi:hypothetical protein
MLKSESKKFIFIHVYKVGGQSIRKALIPYCELNPPLVGKYIERLTHFHLIDKYKKLPVHATAQEIRDELGEDKYAQYFKFAFVRNPWDWQVSAYHYGKSRRLHKHYKIINSFKDFNEYIAWRVMSGVKTQSDFLCDKQNNLIVDYIGRIENFSHDFSEICSNLNIHASLPHENKSKHTDYHEYYNEESIELIRNAYKADIERFGYEY